MNFREDSQEESCKYDFTVAYLLGVIFILLMVCSYQRYELSNINHGTPEHLEIIKLCEESIDDDIGCNVEFGPYAQFESIVVEE